eukprot:COSAG06_NODE_30126_length_544_cov_0.930337_1_plen_163_part_10
MAEGRRLDANDLFNACCDGKIDEVKAHDAAGGDLNLRAAEYGNKIGLLGGAEHGQRDVVAWLVRASGIEIDAQDVNGWTALHHAAPCGHADCAFLLLEGGANSLIKTNDGDTPLEVAQHYNKTEVVGIVEGYRALMEHRGRTERRRRDQRKRRSNICAAHGWT